MTFAPEPVRLRPSPSPVALQVGPCCSPSCSRGRIRILRPPSGRPGSCRWWWKHRKCLQHSRCYHRLSWRATKLWVAPSLSAPAAPLLPPRLLPPLRLLLFLLLRPCCPAAGRCFHQLAMLPPPPPFAVRQAWPGTRRCSRLGSAFRRAFLGPPAILVLSLLCPSPLRCFHHPERPVLCQARRSSMKIGSPPHRCPSDRSSPPCRPCIESLVS